MQITVTGEVFVAMGRPNTTFKLISLNIFSKTNNCFLPGKILVSASL